MSALSEKRLAEIRERVTCPSAAQAAKIGEFEACAAELVVADAPALLAEVGRLRAGIEALHRPVLPIFSWRDGLRFDEPCPDCNGKAGVHPCGCWSDEDAQYECLECIEPKDGYPSRRVVPWPCETAALLNPTEGESY